MILEVLEVLLRPFLPPPISRSCTEEFGPPPAALYDLSWLTDDELVAGDRDTILAAARLHDEARFRAAMTRQAVDR